MGTYIITGNEPYCKDFQRHKIENLVNEKELNLARFDTWQPEVISFLNTFPIFDEKRVAIVSCSLKELNDAFWEFVEHPINTAELVIIPKELDKRSSIYKKLSKANIILECNKISDADKLRRIIIREVAIRNATITEAAYKLFIEKENYEERDDINLYNMISDIERLTTYDSSITEKTVSLLISGNISENIFGIAKMIQQKDTKGLREQALVLSDNVIGTLSALLREYRMAYKGKYFKPVEIGVKYINLSALPKDTLISGMKIIMSAIDGIKDGTLPEAKALFYTFEKLLALQEGLLEAIDSNI